VKFSIPQLISRLTLAKLEREFEGVMNLVLQGLYARTGESAASKSRAKQDANA
jgi:hypothetical protein